MVRVDWQEDQEEEEAMVLFSNHSITTYSRWLLRTDMDWFLHLEVTFRRTGAHWRDLADTDLSLLGTLRQLLLTLPPPRQELARRCWIHNRLC